MQKKNQILERVLIICLIIFVIVLTVFLIMENKLKLEREKQEEEDNKTQSSVTKEVTLSNEEALRIGQELYNAAKSIYWKENIEYVKDNQSENEYDNVVQVIMDGKIYSQIANYDSFVGNKFTANGEAALRTYLGILATKDNDKIVYYIPLAERGGNVSYIDTYLEVSSITADQIIFNARSKYYPDGVAYNPNELTSNIKTEEKTSIFVIRKSSDNIWRIESFTLPN